MRYVLKITKKAKKDMDVLDCVIRERIVQKMRFFVEQDNPISYAKKIKNSNLGDYRFRIGDYRVIFEITKDGKINILLILRVRHRREVYFEK